MAHLWIFTSPDWTAHRLAGDLFTLEANDGPAIRIRSVDAVPSGGAVLRRRAAGDGSASWLLFAPPLAVWINGRPLFAGMRLLRDKDEIRLQGKSLFFSTEMLARVTAYPGGERPAHCPRCRQAIQAGSAAVECPSCGLWHHQSSDCSCWSYTTSCAVCDQATALEAGYRWTPAEAAP